MIKTKVAVIGGGWTGASAAFRLHESGVVVEVFEKSSVLGGHSRVETHNGVVFEPNGPHIFHTSDPEVVRLVNSFGLTRRYIHRPLTEVLLDGEPRLLSWPLQINELQNLPWWGQIRRELENRPGRPCKDNFETYCLSIMGETLYRLFIYHYTQKQWGMEPCRLGAHFAPKRIDLRTDGERGLFRDTWQYFPAEGVNGVIEAMLAPVSTSYNCEILLTDLIDHLYREFDGVICTAPLDIFCANGENLPWRGIRSQLRFVASVGLNEKVTAAYTINKPHDAVPYTRTVETKHASGQVITGSVVCEEFPNSDDRHYPVLTADNSNQARNQMLKEHIRSNSPVPVWFCGRLANYQYIDQDQAIRQGLDCAAAVMQYFAASPDGSARPTTLQ